MDSKDYYDVEWLDESPLPDKMGWISVEDRLPAGEGERVLCFTHSGLYEVGYYYKGEWERERGGTFKQSLYTITHWRELPAPPSPIQNK